MAMNIDKLIAAAEKAIITDDDIRKLKKRLAAAEKRFEKERSERENFPPGFLDREYTL